ncbi:ion transporter, partial [Breoghania sp. JC706]|uniref:ion transporter n=1 Tax=Breoghania sp. JC706 TaxID=3117732 RepID=UPI00300B5FAC
MAGLLDARHFLYRNLNPEAWPHKGLSPLNKAISILVIISVTSSILETESTIISKYGVIFKYFDLIVGSVFAIEYILRVFSSGEEEKYKGISGRIRYIISPIALADLAAIIVFFVTVDLTGSSLLRLLRLSRLLVIAKLTRYSQALANIVSAIYTRRIELLLSLLVAFGMMLLSATFMYFAEAEENPESFGSIPRALWWGVATVTKVGYAGAFPQTVLGKVFAALFAIAAVGVVAMPTGILAGAFSEAFRENARRAPTKHQSLAESELGDDQFESESSP